MSDTNTMTLRGLNDAWTVFSVVYHPHELVVAN